MQWTLGDLQKVTGGRLHGDPATLVDGIRGLDQAGPEHLSFVRSPKHMEGARESRAGALLVPPGGDWGRPVIEVDNPEIALIQVLTVISRQQLSPDSRIHPTAVVEDGAEIGADVTLGPHAVVEAGAHVGARSWVASGSVIGRRTRLGVDCRIYPNVTLYHDVVLGDRVIIHSGTVIGADGFGYVQHEGSHVKIPQVGQVIIEDDVEIGSLTTIDRGMIDPTRVARGVKIDDHCHIAHNCTIGELSLLTGGVLLAGSVKVGRGVVFGGDSGSSDNLEIGDGAVIGGCAKVFRNVPPGGRVWGYPARPEREILKIQAALPDLPQMRRTVRELSERMDRVESKAESSR